MEHGGDCKWRLGHYRNERQLRILAVANQDSIKWPALRGTWQLWMEDNVSSFYKVLVYSMTLVGKDTEDNMHVNVYRKTAALQSTRSLTYVLQSCLVSNDIGFMQKSSLCHVSQSCKAPGKCKAFSQ